MSAAAWGTVAAGYLVGSISFAVLLVRLKTGTDIRKEGSGNAGATNVLRAHGRTLGLLVALLDVAKGAATPVRAVRALAPYPALACIGVFVAVVWLSRYVSLGSVVAMTLLPIACGLFGAPLPTVMAAGGAAVLTFCTHLDTLTRLARGEERRLGRR